MTFKLKNRPSVKNMIFAGCSFTWGQGLYYYSGMDSVQEPPPFLYRSQLVRLPHFNFAQAYRFPRLVANYFGTAEICQPYNGGSTHANIHFWRQAFEDVDDNKKSINSGTIIKQIYADWGSYLCYEDISHVIYQFTQWERSLSPVQEFNSNLGRNENISHGELIHTSKHFIKFLESENLTVDGYIEKYRTEDIRRTKEFLQNFEDYGIKVYVLVWPDNVAEAVLNDPWLRQRYIHLEYNGKVYTDIDKMQEANKNLIIKYDFEEFITPPEDLHPSLKCHKIIADNIIRHIESRN